MGTSWLVLMSESIFSSYSIIGVVILLVIGIIILDTAMQAQHITNQTFILSSHDKEESWALTASYAYIQWIGICMISIGVCIINVFIQRKSISNTK